MAAYTTLYDASGNTPNLDKQIMVALAIKANVIAKSGAVDAAKKAFCLETLRDPTAYLMTIRNYIFAEYNTQTVAAITGATDAQVQTAVNAAVDTLLGV